MTRADIYRRMLNAQADNRKAALEIVRLGRLLGAANLMIEGLERQVATLLEERATLQHQLADFEEAAVALAERLS